MEGHGEGVSVSSIAPQPTRALSVEERRSLRKERRETKDIADGKPGNLKGFSGTDDRFTRLLSRNEDDLLQFVAKVNKVYQELLGRPAPFMTFVFCGMQSAGKSTIMERFLNAVLNIVQEGTGTRCPLDTTCIHDSSCVVPTCELSGEELPVEHRGSGIRMEQVFERITEHNKKLGDEDRFSTEPLYLVYRSSSVQNMRFVDTPGIISNKSTGRDNREDIKMILRSEMRKPNTKLCVLLEPKEFATNPIVDFCDETLNGRQNWIHNAAFLMTKFDKQLDDSRTGSKANNFFRDFFENDCHPHLVITPTLPKETLPPEQLFDARKALLNKADEYESEKFSDWQDEHERFRQEEGDEVLREEIKSRIGFKTAKRVMREIMLKDTVKRLPEVIASLRQDLEDCQKEEKLLLDRQKFNDARNLKSIVDRMLFRIQERVHSYLDGDLEIALKFPEKLQTLEEEIDDEEESGWASRELNFYTDKENVWRTRIAQMTDFPKHLQADAKFFGGKQYQRAIEFFKTVMIESLPDPYQLSHLVPHTTGYLMGGLQRENWERAMVEITRVSLKDVSHPGINYLIKHIGSIFRRMFVTALDDIKQGEEFSHEFKLMPTGVERHMVDEFEEILWDLMKSVSDETHSSLEPMYSSIDPNLPTFYAKRFDSKSTEDDHDLGESFVSRMQRRMNALFTNSAGDAKRFLKDESKERALERKFFLPDERSSMITKNEVDMILQRSFEYIIALFEFNLVVFKFQINHHLYKGFKDAMRGAFVAKMNSTDWDSLVTPDAGLEIRLNELAYQIKGLSDSLQEVQIMQRRL